MKSYEVFVSSLRIFNIHMEFLHVTRDVSV